MGERNEKIRKKLSGLPPRQPRGSLRNWLRMFMLPFLLEGMSPEEAKTAAKQKIADIAAELLREDK